MMQKFKIKNFQCSKKQYLCGLINNRGREPHKLIYVCQ
jgi:hypothetical protein